MEMPEQDSLGPPVSPLSRQEQENALEQQMTAPHQKSCGAKLLFAV
eukprot:CAMPEP_0174338626 /NCGR_PEP_ID=MMETSP0810-20121108/23290_1 /TAXON_ID=73025 ORGANISM="Eutreptiella gymnastica-like, Strain CCMP1594" /NCGR_SAMPLE_ID=MMETSP0810 /ASSEMBLY_ACC=CAM_ASM_000659 /LENGTH=45 /DNA_ID= /DNA_START= /DNA_END= /DNA_ORIENTATION=